MFGSNKKQSRQRELERAEVAMFNIYAAETLGDKSRTIDRTLAEVEVAKLRSADKAQRRGGRR